MTRVDLRGISSVRLLLSIGFSAAASTAGDGWSVHVKLSRAGAPFRWDRLRRYTVPLLSVW